MATGITKTHHRNCPSRRGGPCGRPCKPSFQAWVWSRRDNRKIKKSFPTEKAAREWRAATLAGVSQGAIRSQSGATLREAATAWLDGAKSGLIRTRSGDVYKPSAIRSYEAVLNNRILKDLGAHKFADIQRRDVQDLVDRLAAEGLDASTIRNQLMPLRAICRRAVSRGELSVNPTMGLELPAVRGRRDRVASPAEAVKLLDALDDHDRALWATAMYAGLRRGELMALEWENVDLHAGVIRVTRAYDPVSRVFVAPKSRAGTRNVPIASVLRGHLLAHRLRGGRASGLVFGKDSATPFHDRTIQGRALKAWRAAKLAPIGMHEARHTFASLMIAAGVNAKALSTYLGHATVSITLDRYGHLFPGNEDQAATLLDQYLSGPQSGPQAVERVS